MIAVDGLPEEVLAELGRTAILYAQIEWTVAGLIAFLDAPNDRNALVRIAKAGLSAKLSALKKAIEASTKIHGVSGDAVQRLIKHIKDAVEWRDRLVHGHLMLDSNGETPLIWRIHKEGDPPHPLTLEELRRTNGQLSAAIIHLKLMASRICALVSDSRS